MSQTLQGYITATRYLLHDATGVFYTTSQITDYVNQARERVVRDTGCLRTMQTSTTPCTPVPGGSTPYSWSANTAVALNDYIFSNIYIYQVVGAGILDGNAPPYPFSGTVYPPSTPFLNGTATLQYVGQCEVVNFSCLPQGNQTLDVLNVNLYWGNTRIPMRYLPWTQFNAELRYWQNNVQRPICFSIYGQNQIYFGPVPDQSYIIDLDTVVLPTALVNATDIDTIISPYTSPVPYYAAYLAKYYEQSFGEAEIYKQEYIKHTQAVLVSISTRRIPDPYSNPY